MAGFSPNSGSLRTEERKSSGGEKLAGGNCVFQKHWQQAAKWQRNHHWGTKNRPVVYHAVASCEQKVAQRPTFSLLFEILIW